MYKTEIIEKLNKREITVKQASVILGVSTSAVYLYKEFTNRHKKNKPRVDVGLLIAKYPRAPYEPVTKWIKRMGVSFVTYKKYIYRIK
jgi:hypothetical protein